MVFAKKDKVQIRVRVCALLWGIWNIQTDFVYNISNPPCVLQVTL
jgi:hypothetical protein